jgi:hypothetical protein
LKCDSRGVRFSIWLYAKLLALYPVSFQQEYGRDMALTFRNLCRREFGRFGLNGLARLWLETVIDLAGTALQEHLSEVRLLSRRQGFIRAAGILGALGGLLSIVSAFFLYDVYANLHLVPLITATYLLTAVGTIGNFMAGRYERDINVALGVMLLGALLAATSWLFMAAGIDVWTIFLLGVFIVPIGMILLGIEVRKNPGFLRPAWLPIVIGFSMLVPIILSLSLSDIEEVGIIAWITSGAGWILLGLLLLSGNVRTDAQPPTPA